VQINFKARKKPTLYIIHTDWNLFREKLDSLVVLETPLKTNADIDVDVERLTKIILTAAWQATPDRNETSLKETCPVIVKQQIAEKKKSP
jgi:hypothetical protein